MTDEVVTPYAGGKWRKGQSGNPSGKSRAARYATTPADSANDAIEPPNAGRNPDGRFAKGNAVNLAGKPKGTRHAVTLAVEALLDGEADRLTRKAIERAMEGDLMALRLCLDRIAPPRKERTVQFDLPSIKTVADTVAAHAAIGMGVATGELTPGEASALSTVVGGIVKSLELTMIEDRLAAIEAHIEQGKV